jgi:hypothetical protein
MPCFSRKLLSAGAILFLMWGFPPLAVPQAAVVSPLQTATFRFQKLHPESFRRTLLTNL